MARPIIAEKIFTIRPEHLDANGEFDAGQIAADQDFKAVKVGLSAGLLLKKIKGKFPDSVEDLDLSYSNITEMKGKFDSIKRLRLSSCANLQFLDLSANLEKLDLFCSNIETITGKLNSIKELRLSNCKNLRFLDANIFSANLEELDLSYSGIETITGKFDSIKKLDLSYCKNFEFLDLNIFSANLEDLELEYSGIKRISENLLDSIKKLNLLTLNLFDCEKIPYSDDLFLELIEIGIDRDILYPCHFSNNIPIHFHYKEQEALTNKLNQAIEKAKKIDGNFKAEETKEFITKFLQEGANRRGGMRVVAAELLPIIKFTIQNPESLFWIEETIKSVPEHINQPVATISKITSWIELASQKAMEIGMSQMNREVDSSSSAEGGRPSAAVASADAASTAKDTAVDTSRN